MNVVQACDGKSAWLEVQSQTHDATQMMGEFERGISLFGGGWGIYQQALAGTISGQAIGDEEIDGKKVSGVAVQASFGLVKLYFDPTTHLLAAARYESAGPQGASDASSAGATTAPSKAASLRSRRWCIATERNIWNPRFSRCS